MEQNAFLSDLCSKVGCWCRRLRQGPGETAEADSMQPLDPTLAPAQAPVQAEEQMEVAESSLCCAGSGGIQISMPPSWPPRCWLQDLPPELLVEIFALLPGTDLASLAQTCTQFRSILHTDSIWRRRCREEYGICENFQDLEAMGMSCREFYTKLLHPYRKILGLWRVDADADADASSREILKVAMDGLCITGKRFVPPSCYLNVDASKPWMLLFRIRLKRKSAKVECVEHYTRPHICHLKIQKKGFTTKSNHRMSRCIQKHLPQWVNEERGSLLLQDTQVLMYCNPDCLTYPICGRSRLYFPRSYQDDLIRPGIFVDIYDVYSLKVAFLIFYGNYARATNIRRDPIFPSWQEMLEIHLLHRIQLPNVEILQDFDVLSRMVQEIHEQVIQEQQEEEDRPEHSEGHGWQSPAQPSVRESRAAALEEQPAHSFVLPAGVDSRDQNYPRTYRMCFYGIHIVPFPDSINPQHFPGIFILFDEDHFGFLSVEQKRFTLYRRFQRSSLLKI